MTSTGIQNSLAGVVGVSFAALFKRTLSETVGLSPEETETWITFVLYENLNDSSPLR
jgi:hypothetical protein